MAAHKGRSFSRPCFILGYTYIALMISMATYEYSDTGPQFAVGNSEWKLAEPTLLKVMHLLLDRECAGKEPSAMYCFSNRQKSLTDAFVATGLLYTNQKASVFTGQC